MRKAQYDNNDNLNQILTVDSNYNEEEVINSGNPKIDELIKKINSKYCDDSIKWINDDGNYNTFKNIRPIKQHLKYFKIHHLCRTSFIYGLTKELSNNGLDNANVMKKRNMEI
ncbi:hypothetical protein Glove_320g24 [Diversispora epigaea]|uniref:Uncharacterized protein n=1 Tax=Diversispora epigaea TaxID=1348612 RepID=A0A397HW61_9GLOM|nr:hypothetical protein Glove_320g24 [Diversispora epigaea]